MDFLTYLDKYELQANNELVQAQHAVDRRAIERSTIQDIRTQFLNLNVVEAEQSPAVRKGWARWEEMKVELIRRKDDELRKQILIVNDEWNIYQQTLTQVLDLMEEMENS